MVLIVTLLGWSFNQPATACTGMRPRAAAVVQAGASPASTEPSLTRHICCPGKKSQALDIQPSSFSNCSIRATPDLRCCTVSRDSQGMPPRSSLKPNAAKILLLIPNALSASPRSASGTLFSAVPSPPFSISSRHTVLRNRDLPSLFKGSLLRVSAWDVLPTLRSIEINQKL
jgi:hypothetical protein